MNRKALNWLAIQRQQLGFAEEQLVVAHNCEQEGCQEGQEDSGHQSTSTSNIEDRIHHEDGSFSFETDVGFDGEKAVIVDDGDVENNDDGDDGDDTRSRVSSIEDDESLKSTTSSVETSSVASSDPGDGRHLAANSKSKVEQRTYQCSIKVRTMFVPSCYYYRKV